VGSAWRQPEQAGWPPVAAGDGIPAATGTSWSERWWRGSAGAAAAGPGGEKSTAPVPRAVEGKVSQDPALERRWQGVGARRGTGAAEAFLQLPAFSGGGSFHRTMGLLSIASSPVSPPCPELPSAPGPWRWS